MHTPRLQAVQVVTYKVSGTALTKTVELWNQAFHGHIDGEKYDAYKGNLHIYKNPNAWENYIYPKYLYVFIQIFLSYVPVFATINFCQISYIIIG